MKYTFFGLLALACVAVVCAASLREQNPDSEVTGKHILYKRIRRASATPLKQEDEVTESGEDEDTYDDEEEPQVDEVIEEDEDEDEKEEVEEEDVEEEEDEEEEDEEEEDEEEKEPAPETEKPARKSAYKREIRIDLNPSVNPKAYHSILGAHTFHKREISKDLNPSVNPKAYRSILGAHTFHKREISKDLNPSIKAISVEGVLGRGSRSTGDATKITKCASTDVADAAAHGAVRGAILGPPGSIAGASSAAVKKCSTKL